MFEYGILIAYDAVDFDGLVGFEYVAYGPTILLL